MRHFLAACCVAVFCIPQALANRTIDFFEQYDLSELSYVGMNGRACGFDKYNNLATVLDPQGFRHPVRLGDHMGTDFGMVSKISAANIELIELYKDQKGEWAERTVVLPLIENPSRSGRWLYEYDRLLGPLGRSNEGKQLRDRLVLCRELFGKDAERLACFDAAVGMLF